MNRVVEDKAQPEHLGLLLPMFENSQSIGVIKREIPQDSKTSGMLPCRLNGNEVGLTVPSGRLNDGGRNASQVHILEYFKR